jgi:hypothetical protein
VKGYVARRLREVAVGSETRPEFGHLSADDRQAIREILEDTKRGF